MNNPICLHCGKRFNGNEFLKLVSLLEEWKPIKCPYCEKEQEYKLEFEMKICYRKGVEDETERE